MDCRKSDYLDVYFSRINHFGSTTSERIQNSAERIFEKRLSESPHKVDLSVERGLYFSGIILPSKDKEEKKIMSLNVANDIPVIVGDIVNWKEKGQVEKWIIFSKERKVNESYQTFSIIRCNYYVKWIDAEGHLQGSWCYFTSSLDSKVKENFRTWNSLITPQANKYAEMIMPRHNFEQGTTFIVEDEGWHTVELDFSSVPGIMYVSLSEEKINTIYDDLENDIADIDRLAKYKIILPEKQQSFSIGDEIKIVYTMSKNGHPYEGDCNITSSNKKIAKKVNGKLTAIAAGEVELIIQFEKIPEVQAKTTIIVGKKTEKYYYLEGAETIKLDRMSVYHLTGTDLVSDNISYSLQNAEGLATISSQENGACVVRANASNKLGSFRLVASYEDKEYTKEIKVIPLW